MKNNLKYIFLSLLIILPSIFNSESFIFIRLYALFILIFFIILLKIEHIKVFNKTSLIIIILYLISIAIHFNFSVNSFNTRIHFAEYGAYILILILFSSIKWEMNRLLLSIANAVILSALIQIMYSMPKFMKGVYRVQGNTNYPNFLSLLLICGIVSAVILCIRFLKQERKKIFAIYLFISLILLFFAFQTGSRNIFILLPLSVFIMCLFYNKKIAFAMLFIIVIILLIIPSTAKNRLLHEKEINPYGVQRVNIYKQVFNIALNNLPFGIGYNNLHYYTLKNNFSVDGRISRYGSYAKIAHNEYLEWLVNSGLIGVFIILIILISVIRFLLIKIQSNYLKQLLIIYISIFAVLSFIDNALYLPYNAVIFIIIFALILRFVYKNIHINLLKYIIIIYLVIYSFIIVIDISSTLFIKRLAKEIKTMNMNKVDNNITLIKQLDYLYYLQGNPDIIKNKIHYNENLYRLTKYIKYFQAMLDDYENLMNYTKMDYTVYRDYARLLLKYKNSVLRKNNNINEKIDYFYNQSIYYNPHNPFLRYEYANFLINIDKNEEAIEQLKMAVEKEPYFLKGLVLLNELSNDKHVEQKIEYIEQNYNKLIKQTKTDYEKELLRL